MLILKMYSIREITKEVAAAVIKEAVEEDLAEGYRDMDPRELGKLNKVYLCAQPICHFCKVIYSL